MNTWFGQIYFISLYAFELIWNVHKHWYKHCALDFATKYANITDSGHPATLSITISHNDALDSNYSLYIISLRFIKQYTFLVENVTQKRIVFTLLITATTNAYPKLSIFTVSAWAGECQRSSLYTDDGFDMHAYECTEMADRFWEITGRLALP